jgi:hypothetical protein
LIGSSEEDDSEIHGAREFLLYWRPDIVDDNLAHRPLLAHAASNQLHRAHPGDTLWIATVRKGIFLVGKLPIGECTDWEGAKRRLDTEDVWEARHHAIAVSGGAEMMSEIRLADIAAEMRFESPTNDRFNLSNGKINPQQLQTMRVLTNKTARRLREKWDCREQIILKVGFEGGTATVFGRRTEAGEWEFYRSVTSERWKTSSPRRRSTP